MGPSGHHITHRVVGHRGERSRSLWQTSQVSHQKPGPCQGHANRRDPAIPTVPGRVCTFPLLQPRFHPISPIGEQYRPPRLTSPQNSVGVSQRVSKTTAWHVSKPMSKRHVPLPIPPSPIHSYPSQSRQGVSLMMDFVRQARLQPMAFGSYISNIHSDMSFLVPEAPVPPSSGNNTGHKPENDHVPTSQNNKWFNRVLGTRD